MIVFLSKDLMILSNARSLARSGSRRFEPIDSPDKLSEFLAEGCVELVLIDLQMPGLQADQISQILGEQEYRPRVVAFAQHVNAQALATGNENFDEVMTRGQFAKSLPALLASS